MAEPRPLPPPLEARCPDCSICGEETSYQDDGFACERCGCWWPELLGHESSGEWLDDEAAQCEVTVQPYLENTWVKDEDERKHKTYRCVRDADHLDSPFDEGREHANPDMKCLAKGWA